MCPAMISMVITDEQTLVNKNSRQPDDHILTPENSIKPLVVSQQPLLTRLSKGNKSQTDCSSSSSPISDIGNEIGVLNYHPASNDLASSQYEFWNDYDQADLDVFDEIDAQEKHTQDQSQYPHHQQQQQHQLPVLQSTSKSLPYIPPVVSPLRPNLHNSVSQKRPLPPVSPNQIVKIGNLSISNTQNLNKQALPSPKPLEPKRINTDNGFELSIKNLPVQSLRNQQFKKPLPLPPQSSSVTLELEHDQSGFMEEKKEWNVWFEKYLRQLDEKKPIVWGGYTQDEIYGLMRQLNPEPDQSGEQKRLIDVWRHMNLDFEGILGL
ncbi:hypothetical protein PPACK8108_LOCUS9828 [Phakopsora pachyrhizi]|uniref:Uncharacterized protein n=1 Tax=Phakopsora pachyrhizi TaxID=170000 RepID=A0AAV0AZC8_PHAPC|nr:hypothetical protein PPACK8108_LOCUS9828 [Phakopsora pachyrhizi]